MQRAQKFTCAAPHVLEQEGLHRLVGHNTLADLLYPAIFEHQPPDWLKLDDGRPPPLPFSPPDIHKLLLEEHAERRVKLDDATPYGGIDFEEEQDDPDEGYLDFAVRTLQISTRLHQAMDPSGTPFILRHTSNTPIVHKDQDILDIVFALHDEVGSRGKVLLPPRGPWEYTGDSLLDSLAAVIETASTATAPGKHFSSRGADLEEPGSFLVTPVRDTTSTSPTRYTMIPEIVEVTQDYLPKPLQLPSLSLPAVLDDIGFNTLTLPTPLYQAELYVAFKYLQLELFSGLEVFPYDDDMAKSPPSSCGVGFSAGLHQNDLALSAAQGRFLVGKPIPNAINAIPKYVPATDSRTRVVCGVNVLVTAAMKALTKPVQEAIVRRTQSDHPGVSAVGLAKNDGAVNRYFHARLAGFDVGPDTLVFSADHTKCDRTVASQHVGTAYAYLTKYSGNDISLDLIKWMLRTSVEAPMVIKGLKVDGRMCEASGDATTCHTNTVFNVHVHIAVFMRSIINDERYDPKLRHAIYQCYHGDYTTADEIIRVLREDMRFVMFSDDGLVFTKPEYATVWCPENWSLRLQSISGLRVDRSKSSQAQLRDGVEFLGCHLQWAPGSFSGRQFGPLVLAPEVGRLAKQLTLIKQGSLWSGIERVGGILLSAAPMLFTHPEEYWMFYDTCADWVSSRCSALAVDVPVEFPSKPAVIAVAFGDYVQPQTSRNCVCGAKAFTVCTECVVDTPLCSIHASQHFGSSSHLFTTGSCPCGVGAFDRLGFDGYTIKCAVCAQSPNFIPFTAMSKMFPPGADVDTHGDFTDWTLTDPYWAAVQTSARIAISQSTIFRRDIGSRVSSDDNLKPGTRFKVKVNAQWLSAVVDSTGAILTKAGPVSGTFQAMPLATEIHIQPKHFEHLRQAIYIQGPPGTGKTTQAVKLIRENLGKKILYTSPSNASVHEMVSKLNSVGIKPTWLRPRLSAYSYPEEMLATTSQVKVCTTGCVSESADVLLLDECSLLSPAEVCKVASAGKLVYLLGDHLQLSPVTNPPMPWGRDYWLLNLVREHRVLSTSWRFGPEVVSLIKHIYPSLLPAAHDTTVTCRPISDYKSMPPGQTLVMYNHDLLRFEDGMTVDASQGSTFDNVNLVVTLTSPFTTREARVNVAVTRARRKLNIYAPASWYAEMREAGFAFPAVVEHQTAAVPLVYADFEFSHTLAVGATKHRNMICEFGVYDPVHSRETVGYVPARDPDTGERPQKVVIPSVCKHARGHDNDNAYRPIISTMWKALLKGDAVALYNGKSDIQVLSELRQKWCLPTMTCACSKPAKVFSKYRSVPLAQCKHCYDMDTRKHDLRFLVNFAELQFVNITGPKLTVAHSQHCGYSHGDPHHAISDALMTACHHAHLNSLGRAQPAPAPKGTKAVLLASGPWTIRGLVVIDGKCCLPAILPVIPSQHNSPAQDYTDCTVIACPLTATGNACGSCAQHQRRANGYAQKNPGWSLIPAVQLQTALSSKLVTGFETVDGKPYITLSVSPYRFPYRESVAQTLEAIQSAILHPLPVKSVVRGLGLWGSTVTHSALPLVPVEADGVLTINTKASNGVIVSWSKIDANSLPAKGARFEVGCVEASSSSAFEVPYWLTKVICGKTVPLSTRFSIGALVGVCDYSSYTDISPPPEYLHIFCGEQRSGGTKIDGVHHVAGPIQKNTIRPSLYGSVADCCLTGASKMRTTLVDFSLSDFVSVIQEAEQSFTTQSKVCTATIDFHEIRFMVWKGKTMYPVAIVEQMLELPQKHTLRTGAVFPKEHCDTEWYTLGVDVGRTVVSVIPRPKGGQLRVQVLGFPVSFLDPFLAETNAILVSEAPHLTIINNGESEADNYNPENICPGGYLLVMDPCSGRLSRFTRYFGTWTRYYSSIQGLTSWTWFLFSGRAFTPLDDPTDSDYVLHACYPWREATSSMAVPRKSGNFRVCPNVPIDAVCYDFERVAALAKQGRLYVS